MCEGVIVVTVGTTGSSQVVMFFLHSVALLWPSEWEVISKLFIVDQAISLHCSSPETATGSTAQYTTAQYTTQPGKCSGECVRKTCVKDVVHNAQESSRVHITPSGQVQDK